MGRYQPMGSLVECQAAEQSRRQRAIAMFEAGMTPLMVSKRMGLSHTAMIRLREEWQSEREIPDIDPALAIGTIDDFLAKELLSESKQQEKKAGTQLKADKVKAVPPLTLDSATERALRERTAEAFDEVFRLMGMKPRRSE